MHRTHLYGLTALLTLMGLGLFAYKVLAHHYPLTPDATVKRWYVESKITFTADQDAPVKVTLFVPRQDQRFTVLDEGSVAKGYGTNKRSTESGEQIHWSTRSAGGQQTIYYRAIVRKNEQPRAQGPAQPPPAANAKPFEGAELAAANALLDQIYRVSADVETQVSELLKRINQAPDENLAFLLGKQSTPAQRLEIAQRILQQGKITSRIVQGVNLENHNNQAYPAKRQVEPVYWLEILDGNWRIFDPETGQQPVPDYYLALRYGIGPMAKVSGGQSLAIETSLSHDEANALSLLGWREGTKPSPLYDFSLLNLPLSNQAIMKTLLMIPVGSLLLVFMSNLVGVKMFGTFMPVLIALAFRETRLLWGILLFSLIVALGLSIRFYLEKLKLLLVPRLASVLIAVILLIIFISILTHLLKLQHGLSISLFPIVIMTMTIERMSIVWEEHGYGEALQQGLGSLLMAALAYYVMNLQILQHLFFVFPELLLLCLAAVLLMGRYSGYRLMELYRFRQMRHVG